MNHPPSAQDRHGKTWKKYLAGLEESTGSFGSEEIIRCQACGKWVETVLAQFSRYTGEPTCAGCGQFEETGD